jgi:hypothetical protein
VHAHASADAAGDAQEGTAVQATAERLAALEDELDRLRAHLPSCSPAGEACAPEVMQESNVGETSGRASVVQESNTGGPPEGACVVPGPLAAYPLVSDDMLTDLKMRFKRQCWECKYGVCVRQKNSWMECRIPKGLQGVGFRV